MKKNNRYIILRSLQRSGTHAISMWLEQDKNVRFYNNISVKKSRFNSTNSCIHLEENKSLIKNKLENKLENKDFLVFGLSLIHI